MKQKLLPLIICLTVALPLPIKAQELKTKTVNGKSFTYYASQVLVCYKEGEVESTRRSLQSQYNISVIKSLPDIRVDLMSVPSGWTEDRFINELKRNTNIDFAEFNGQLKASFTPDDFLGTYPLGSGFLEMESAWDITRGNASIVIAIIDTGVDLEHTDLNANSWVNTDEIAGNSIDDDGNGYVDDRNGYDFVNEDGNPDDDNFVDSIFHGTHVSGIAAAVANNGTGIPGVAHNAKIMALKALNAAGGGSGADIAEAIIYAANNGAHVINLSLGSRSQIGTVSAAVATARAANVVVVAASGNADLGSTCTSVDFPAADEGVIAVGNVTTENLINSSSCQGPQVDVSAPGTTILSMAGADPGAASGTRSLTGTSQASPHVAGLAALVLSLQPSMSNDDVARYISFYADDLGPTGHDNAYGFGRIDANATLQAVESGSGFVSNPGFPNESFSYPNPYDPATGRRVVISLPLSLGTSGIKIKIFNNAGVRVKTLSGTNEWDGRNEDGNVVASGLYFYFAETNAGDTKGKLTILR